MRIIFLLILIMIGVSVPAQDESIKRLRIETERSIRKDETDTSSKTWRKGGLFNINVSQGTLNNWAAGGDDFSLSINSLVSLYMFFKKEKHSWDNTFDFNFGYVNTTSLGSRKNDDRFDLLSKYGYALSKKLNLAGLVNFRSQFFKGYIFPDNVKTFASSFMAPGYVLLSAGLDYKLTRHLSVYASPATARWVIVKDTAISNKGLYGVGPGNDKTLEFGGFATITYFQEFNKFISYKGRIDLFSNYRKEAENVDLFMSNILNAKLGKVLMLSWSVDMIYDDDVRLFGPVKTSPGLQLKSLVGIGVTLKFHDKKKDKAPAVVPAG